MWRVACEDANSKLVEFVTVADVDDEKRFDDSFMQFWKLKFGHKAKFVQTLSTRFEQEFEVEVQAKLLKLKFGQYFAAEAWWGYEVNVWSRFWC